MTNGASVPPDHSIIRACATTPCPAPASPCREAALAFLNESRHWDKADLELWLRESYAPLTRSATAEVNAVWPVQLLRDIDQRLVKRMINNARSELLITLMRVIKGRAATFALQALIDDTVVRHIDETGTPQWAPSAKVTRLAERVVSLLAVDYLEHSEDYECGFAVCARCGVVSFDAAAQSACKCRSEHVLAAGRRRVTIPMPDADLESEPRRRTG